MPRPALTIHIGIPFERDSGVGSPDGPCGGLEELPHEETPQKHGGEAQGPHGAGNRHVRGSGCGSGCGSEMESRIRGAVAAVRCVSARIGRRRTLCCYSGFVICRAPCLRRLSCVGVGCVCRRVGRVDGFEVCDSVVRVSSWAGHGN